MFPRSRIAALLTLASLALAGCGGGGGSSPAALPAASQNQPVTPYTGPSQLASFTWGSSFMRSAQYTGPANVASLSVDVQSAAAEPGGTAAICKNGERSDSPMYRRFITPQQIGSQYGASQSAYLDAAGYFGKYHLGVGTWPQRLSMVVSGKQSDMEAAFGTKFGTYREYGRTFVGPMQQPHFSRAIPVAGVIGLVHVNMKRTMLIRPGNGNYLGMSGAQLRRAFDFTGAANAGFNGTGINVGIIGTGPISSADVPEIGKLSNVSVASVSVATVSAQASGTQNNNTGTATFDPYPTGLQTPPPVTAPCPQSSPGVVTGTPSNITCNQEDGEAQLDTEQLAQLAPGSSVHFYLAYNTKDCAAFGISPCLGVEGIYLTDDEIQQAIADNSVDTLSLSFDEDEPTAQASGYFDTSGVGPGPAEMAALASEGIAVFVASGDNGAHACADPSTGAPTAQFCVEYPASDPSVVAAGGVNYPMDSTGNLPRGAEITAWAFNTTQGGDGYADNSIGGGGGVSKYFAAPSYQSGLPASIQGTSRGGKRVLPDIAMLADPLTGALFLMDAAYPSSAGVGPVGGTSVAAPEMAAEWAVVLQACKANASCAIASGPHPWRLGNPNGVLYKIYGNASKYAGAFYDVLAGNNGSLSAATTPSPTYYGGYSAGTGFDLVTGLGVPFTGHLIDAVVSGQKVP